MKRILVILGVIFVVGIGYYLVSPIFRNIEVNDEAPIPSGIENLSTEERAEEEKQMEEANKVPLPLMDEKMPRVVKETEKTFALMGTAGHPVEGSVRIVETDEGTVIRFENFKTINGPILHLYLAKDLKAKDYVDLGPIRGTSGNINYFVPEDVDIKEYRYIMHWCVPFRVLFNYVDLGL